MNGFRWPLLWPSQWPLLWAAQGDHLGLQNGSHYNGIIIWQQSPNRKCWATISSDHNNNQYGKKSLLVKSYLDILTTNVIDLNVSPIKKTWMPNVTAMWECQSRNSCYKIHTYEAIKTHDKSKGFLIKSY